MRDQYMRAGEGFIISYSITDRRSFQEARHFKQLIYRVRRTVDTPVVLVGNKSDLVHLRQVNAPTSRLSRCKTHGGHVGFFLSSSTTKRPDLCHLRLLIRHVLD